MNKYVSLSLILCLFGLHLFGQGAIAGKVVEEESGFEAIGANVIIAGTTTGMATDLDGSYIIKDLEPGTYTIECSYVGFETIQITDVVVTDGNTTLLDITLGSASTTMDEVVVKAKAFKNTETAVLTLQKKAPVVLDGISAAQISKSGDSDVASAVRRVTGVTIEGGKYVYVRGLGDRYSKTTLNGSEVPGLDPNRNTVQMDLFPTNLVDNIIVYKTFSPDLPGDFSGGYVDIRTKDFPEEPTLRATLSVGYNSIATFNSDYLTYQGGGTDWLGIDDGTRAAPSAVTEALRADAIPTFTQATRSLGDAQTLRNLTEEFNQDWTFQNESQFLNHGLSISGGNQFDLGEKAKLGLVSALTYSRNYNGYENGQDAIFTLTGPVATTASLTDQINTSGPSFEMDVLWGAMVGSSIKFGSNKIGLTLMHNQNGNRRATIGTGDKRSDEPDDVFIRRRWQWEERGLSTAQLTGKHVLVDANKLEIEWRTSVSRSTMETPDLRFFTNRSRDVGTEDEINFLKPSSDPEPTRYYRDMEQINYDTKVDISYPFTNWNGQSSKFKVGGSHVFRDRTFGEERYDFTGEFSIPNGDIDAFLSSANFITPNPEAAEGSSDFLADNGSGIFLSENVDDRNSYEADQTVIAGYAMVELPITKRLRAIAGARIETTSIRLTTADTGVTLDRFPQLDGEQKLIDITDVLPSLNLNYEITEKMKVRGAYTRTLARPSFRELAPFNAFELAGGFVTVGNPELQRTLVDNIDLRWEFYPSGSEIVSVSGFYKKFDNPIERTFNPEAQNVELTWRNVNDASLYGFEMEVKKKMGFITPKLNNLSLGANFSYIISNTDIDSSELELVLDFDPNAETSREMFGQAPYVFNLLATYQTDNGIGVNLAYNVVGPRLAVITVGATPDYELQPLPSLNFNISKTFGPERKLSVKLSANNLLAPDYKVTATYREEEFPITVFETARVFSASFGYKFK